MANKLEKSRTYVYVFMGIAFALFTFMLVMIAINNKIFKSRVDYHVVLEDAYGLHSHPLVYYKGFEVGKVKQYNIADDHKIKVEFFIYADYQENVYNYSVINAKRNPLSGDVMAFELISPESKIAGMEPLKPTSQLHEVRSIRGQEIIKKVLLKVKEGGVEGIVRKTNSVLDGFIKYKTAERVDDLFTRITSIIDTSLGLINKYSKELDTYSKIVKESGEGPIKSLLVDTKNIITKLMKMIKYVNDILVEIHTHRREISPLLSNTNKTLKKAKVTLDGIHRNPLIKSALGDEQKIIHKVEINE